MSEINQLRLTYLSVRSSTCATTSSLDTIEIIQEYGHKVVMNKFTAVLMVKYHGKDRKPASHVIS